jgi:hypothetical protein
MPSYGSNDGYGPQKLGARPSTRLTEVGAKQQDSSRMASLLAEEDIRPTEKSTELTAVDPYAPIDVQWFQAAKVGDAACLRRLFNERPSLLAKMARGGGQTALHHCAAAGHLACAIELLDRGLMASVRDSQQWTPLHSAADGGQLELVVELMRRGADVAAQDASGETAADLAQSRGHSEVVDSLRRRGDLSPQVTGAQ